MTEPRKSLNSLVFSHSKQQLSASRVSDPSLEAKLKKTKAKKQHLKYRVNMLEDQILEMELAMPSVPQLEARLKQTEKELANTLSEKMYQEQELNLYKAKYDQGQKQIADQLIQLVEQKHRITKLEEDWKTEQQRNESYQSMLAGYEDQFKQMNALITKNETNLHHFYALVKQQQYEMQQQMQTVVVNSYPKETISTQTISDSFVSSTDTDENIVTLCTDLEQSIWQKKLQLEYEQITRERVGLSNREKLIAHKEVKLLEFCRQLKSTHDFDL